MASGPASFIHATAVVIEESGVLIRGASGAGKSSLALLLLAEADRRGRFARMIGDDRVSVQAVNKQVIARAHGAIAGLLECRTLGIIRVPFEAAGVVRLIVDLSAGKTDLPRLPEQEDCVSLVDDIACPRLRLSAPPDELSCHLIFQKLFAG